MKLENIKKLGNHLNNSYLILGDFMYVSVIVKIINGKEFLNRKTNFISDNNLPYLGIEKSFTWDKEDISYDLTKKIVKIKDQSGDQDLLFWVDKNQWLLLNRLSLDKFKIEMTDNGWYGHFYGFV